MKRSKTRSQVVIASPRRSILGSFQSGPSPRTSTTPTDYSGTNLHPILTTCVRTSGLFATPHQSACLVITLMSYRVGAGPCPTLLFAISLVSISKILSQDVAAWSTLISRASSPSGPTEKTSSNPWEPAFSTGQCQFPCQT